MERNSARLVGWSVAGTLAALLIVALFIIYSGMYNVGATKSHTAVMSWALNTMQQRSVSIRAGDTGEPPPLDSAAIRHAFVDYRSMCALCHGAPGVERGEFGKGITPTPPRLERAATMWSDRQIRWILEHGIKLAGMPAFGATHTDRELWALTVVVKRLPELSPDEYQRLSTAEDGESAHQH